MICPKKRTLKSIFILLCKPLGLRLHLLHNSIRSDDLDASTQRHDPAKELVADWDIDIGSEMILVNRSDKDVFAEAVDQNADHGIIRFDGDTGLFTAVHAEKTFGVAGKIESFELIFVLVKCFCNTCGSNFRGQHRYANASWRRAPLAVPYNILALSC